MALGGSTNAIIHLTAVAGRLGIRIPLDRLNAISDETPVLVDLKPVGDGYMEDLYAAGGVGAVLRELRPLLHLDCMTVEGTTLRERLDEPAGWVDRKVIRAFDTPVSKVGGLIALRGSLAPDGAIFKRAAATPALFEVEGRAVVFESLEDLAARIDDPALDVERNDILVLKNAGPHGAGMPEAGYLPIPGKLARAGVKDMVRISDARMSGTAYGTIVLHVAPEAAAGGPLAAVRNGDRIRLSVAQKRIDLLVGEDEIARRLADWTPPPKPARGYASLYRRQRAAGAGRLRSRLPCERGAEVSSLTGGPPQTLAQKLVARAAGRAHVDVGEIVTCRVDLAMLHDSGGPRKVGPMLEALGAKVWDPSRVVVINDHYVDGTDDHSRRIVAISRDWTRANAIRLHDGIGICHVVLPEQGHVRPGMFIVGGDSHAPTGGAFGAYMFGVGATDMAGVLVTGETWLRVPATIAIEWRGRFGPLVTAKDVMLFLCSRLGMDGGHYEAVEYRRRGDSRVADAGADDAGEHDRGARRSGRADRAGRDDGRVAFVARCRRCRRRSLAG